MAPRANFMAWVKQQWKAKLGLVHRRVKDPAAPDMETTDSSGAVPSGRDERAAHWRERVGTAADLRTVLDVIWNDILCVFRFTRRIENCRCCPPTWCRALMHWGRAMFSAFLILDGGSSSTSSIARSIEGLSL
eukprot:9482554-Pyramimonas_sp.AAC.1